VRRVGKITCSIANLNNAIQLELNSERRCSRMASCRRWPHRRCCSSKRNSKRSPVAHLARHAIQERELFCQIIIYNFYLVSMEKVFSSLSKHRPSYRPLPSPGVSSKTTLSRTHRLRENVAGEGAARTEVREGGVARRQCRVFCTFTEFCCPRRWHT